MTLSEQGGLSFHATFDTEDGYVLGRLRGAARRGAGVADELLRRRVRRRDPRPDQQRGRARDGPWRLPGDGAVLAVLDRTLGEADERDSQGGVLTNTDRGDLARVDDL